MTSVLFFIATLSTIGFHGPTWLWVTFAVCCGLAIVIELDA